MKHQIYYYGVKINTNEIETLHEETSYKTHTDTNTHTHTHTHIYIYIYINNYEGIKREKQMKSRKANIYGSVSVISTM